MKKKFILPLIILLIMILLSCLLYHIESIKKIKNNYNEYSITKKDTELYKKQNNEYIPIGTIYNNTYIELDYPTIKSKKDKYFKIKNTDYYIINTDIEKNEKIEKEEKKDYYININKKIKTNNQTNLYKDNTLQFSINESLEFTVEKKDENYYYINFMNTEYQIKQEEIETITEIELPPISEYISIINYNEVKNECETNECITIDNFKKQLETIKENGYYTININDYKLWLNDNINLKEKAILIISNQEDLNEIAKEYNLHIEKNNDELNLVNNNSKSEKGNTDIPKYDIISKTTDEMFMQILNGESIAYIEEKPLAYTHTLPNENSNATEIAVLNYHFFFDPEIGETCPDGNCKTVQDFEQELNYLKKNNYKTLTMDEFTKWMYGEIELPARSVLITIDDGAMGTGTHNGNKLIPLLEKYQAHATLFLITGWWGIDNYSSPYLDIESHTHNMHEGNYCETEQRGSKLLCSSRDEILNDLTTSAEITGSKNAFCFPMYVYNEKTLSVLSEIGFKLAFVGGDYKASRSNNKYQIPRYHIYRETTLDQFIDMIS